MWLWDMAPMKEVVNKGIDFGYRLCILENLNGWVGDRTRASITGALEVPGGNDNLVRG